MLNMSFNDFDNLKFNLYEKNPIIKRFGATRLVADPSVLTPTESDGKWHLFCHSMFGILHYKSEDGLEFSRVQKVVKDAMRPDCKKIGDTYYLYFEKVQRLATRALSVFGKLPWKSSIYLMTSKDLLNWSEPFEVVKADRPYHSCSLGTSISNPFLLTLEDGYRLYYSSALTYLEDCHFSEPTYISCCESKNPSGPFISEEKPIMSPDVNDPILNRGCGCIKVYRLTDCFIGLLNGIYVGEDGKSHSAVMVFKSDDGKSFKYHKKLICPQMCGSNKWMKQYVYACNLAVHGGKAYIYFNARDTSNPILGVEHIGVTIADIK